MILSSDLQSAVDAARARVRWRYPFWLRPFLLRGVIGITLGRRIYFSPAMLQRPPAEVERIVRHELAHVRQVNRLGLIRFLWQYAREYVRHRRSGLTSSEAYRRISFEVEAHAAEQDV